uniref:Uncharacterized protein n=1 Tax=Arundo donax TaxID=35708 RepID=A0A0A9BF33_ARUDO
MCCSTGCPKWVVCLMSSRTPKF